MVKTLITTPMQAIERASSSRKRFMESSAAQSQGIKAESWSEPIEKRNSPRREMVGQSQLDTTKPGRLHALVGRRLVVCARSRVIVCLNELTFLQAAMTPKRARQEFDQAIQSIRNFDVRDLKTLFIRPTITFTDYWLLSSHLAQRASRPVQLSILFLLSAMLAELYPQSPTYNSMLAMASLYITIHIKEFAEPFLLSYCGLQALSVVLDLNWMLQTETGTFLVSVRLDGSALVSHWTSPSPVVLGTPILHLTGSLEVLLCGSHHSERRPEAGHCRAQLEHHRPRKVTLPL